MKLCSGLATRSLLRNSRKHVRKQNSYPIFATSLETSPGPLGSSLILKASINCDQSTNKTSHKTGGKGNDDFAHVFLLLGATLVGAIIGGFLSIRIARYLF